MARRSLTKALSGLGRKSRSDNGDAAVGTPPPAVQLLPAARGPTANGRAGKPPVPWPAVNDSPTHPAAPPPLVFARNSSSSAASSITFATPSTAQQRPDAVQRTDSAGPPKLQQQSRIPLPGGSSPQRQRPDSPGAPASPTTAQQRPQSADSELASLRSQLAAVTGALGPAQRGLTLEAAVRRLVTEVTQAAKGRMAAEEQLVVLREQGNALEQALAAQTQQTEREQTGRQQAEEKAKESQQLIEDLQQELAAAQSESAGHMFQSRAAAAAAPVGTEPAPDEHMRFELESLRGRATAAEERLAVAQSAAEFAAKKALGRAAVDHRVAQLEQQLMHAQASCRYAEDRWDDVMNRLTEVMADHAAQQAAAPVAYGDEHDRNGGLPTIAAVAAAAAEKDTARSFELQQEIDALHIEVHAAQQAAGIAERNARGLQNELAAAQQAAQDAAAAASRKVQQLQDKLARTQHDNAALQAKIDQGRIGHRGTDHRAEAEAASVSAAKLQQEVAGLRQRLADAEKTNALLQQQAAAAASSPTSAESSGTPRRRLFADRQSTDAMAEQANNEAHGEGGSAAAHVQQLETQAVELRTQLRATQAQVVEVSSWLTSNARLLMEVGARSPPSDSGSIGAHRGAAASQKHAGFHSDQVHVPGTLRSVMGR